MDSCVNLRDVVLPPVVRQGGTTTNEPAAVDESQTTVPIRDSHSTSELVTWPEPNAHASVSLKMTLDDQRAQSIEVARHEDEANTSIENARTSNVRVVQ